MSMYKRPLPRAKVTQRKNERVKFTEGTYLHGLLNTGPTVYYKYTPAPVYEKDAYITLLKKNCETLGIPYKDPNIPDYVEPPKPTRVVEPELKYADTIYIKLKILKSGIIRVKIDASIATLNEKYYSKCKTPPLRNVTQAYKSMGFSQDFLDKIKQNYDKKPEEQKRIQKIIDKVFNKEPVKKPKKKKKEEEPVDEEESVEEEEEEDADDDVPGDDEGMDVEPEVEEDVEEPVEEDYFSD